jgi:two-component system, OmpR family, KDP operon response regulator KdpE
VVAAALDDNHCVGSDAPVVLVVEDDTAVRHPLVRFLQMRQFAVVTAQTAEDGIAAIHRHHPQAAIIDLKLKRGSGRDVVQAMPANVPVIIFSGLRSESGDLEITRPRTRLIEKPYSLITLMDTLEAMIAEARGDGTVGQPS